MTSALTRVRGWHHEGRPVLVSEMDGSSYLERVQGGILSVSSLLLIRLYLVHGFLGVADQFGVLVDGW